MTIFNFIFSLDLCFTQPTPQRIRPEHAQTLEKYAWESTEDHATSKLSYIDVDLF